MDLLLPQERRGGVIGSSIFYSSLHGVLNDLHPYSARYIEWKIFLIITFNLRLVSWCVCVCVRACVRACERACM